LARFLLFPAFAVSCAFLICFWLKTTSQIGRAELLSDGSVAFDMPAAKVSVT
jgi:hypothetical protein